MFSLPIYDASGFAIDSFKRDSEHRSIAGKL